MNLDKIEQGARLILEGLEVNLEDTNFATTPQRVAKVYQELFVPKETGWPVFEEDYTDMVIMRGHSFWTCCPHHLLPVKLVASVAYIPNGKIIGASKLVRMLHECNRKPMTQEALTQAAVDKLQELTSGTSLGSAVFMIGKHGCFEIRGVKSDALMITHKFLGRFKEQVELQKRFLDLVSMRVEGL